MLYVSKRQTDRQTDRMRAKLETLGTVSLFTLRYVASYFKCFWSLKLEAHISRSAKFVFLNCFLNTAMVPRNRTFLTS